jgi:competence ComEA-like helix-hairpin-helix protein
MRSGIRYRAPRTKSRTMKSRLRACSLLLLCWILLAAHAVIGKKIPPSTPLDLNTATAAQLAQVPGIGVSSAKAIVQFRQKSGPFERIEDLLAIRGISARRLQQIRPYVNVSQPAPRRPSSSRGSAIFSA